MKIETLRMIYYAFFQSIINYGIIAWGGAYNNNRNLLQIMQNKILKIINKYQFSINNNPLNLEQLYTFESLIYHYDSLRDKFLESESRTRFKFIQMPKRHKTISSKISYITAIRVFNNLDNELKIIKNKNVKKRRLKDWITSTRNALLPNIFS